MALGPVPVEGEDETFKSGFTIRAEKCPNRRGVEEVDQALHGVACRRSTTCWPSCRRRRDPRRLGQRRLQAPWIDDGHGRAVRRLGYAWSCRICSVRRLWERATYQLPGAAFAEREGSYVNHADRLQTLAWAIRPPAGVRVEGRVLLAICSSDAGHVQRAPRAGRSGRRDRRFSAAAANRVRADWAVRSESQPMAGRRTPRTHSTLEIQASSDIVRLN